MIPPALITMVAGWIQRRQQQVITYLLVEKRVLTAQRGGRRLRLTKKRREAPAFMPGMDRRWARRAQCPRAQQDPRSA